MAPKSTSLVWNYFEKETSNIAKCNLCSKKNANTKGLWSHVKLKHPIDNMELGKLVNEDVIKKSKENEMLRKTTSNPNNNEVQPTLKQMYTKKEKYESNNV